MTLSFNWLGQRSNLPKLVKLYPKLLRVILRQSGVISIGSYYLGIKGQGTHRGQRLNIAKLVQLNLKFPGVILREWGITFEGTCYLRGQRLSDNKGQGQISQHLAGIFPQTVTSDLLMKTLQNFVLNKNLLSLKNNTLNLNRLKPKKTLCWH